jgi:hypothetical protein
LEPAVSGPVAGRSAKQRTPSRSLATMGKYDPVLSPSPTLRPRRSSHDRQIYETNLAGFLAHVAGGL